jgi:hypothetical protein
MFRTSTSPRARKLSRYASLVFSSLVMMTLLTAFDWPQFNLNAQHSGNNTQESAITQANVSNLQLLFQSPLPDAADGAPAFVQAASTISGTRDVVLVTTKVGHIIAFDGATGKQIWSRQHPANGCTINNGATGCYTTSSPAIDPNRLYVYSYGLDGFVHKHALFNGAEAIGSGWPATATLKGFDEKGSAPLSIVTTNGGTSYLYVTNSGYPGDAGDYQGHVTAINLATDSQRVFNTLCSDQTVHFRVAPASPSCAAVQSGVWSRSSVVYSPATDLIYIATGNADYNPANHNWGDTVLALHPDGSGTGAGPVDSYTPSNYVDLNTQDLDLGSTNIAILPVPMTSSVQHVAVQSGKDGKLRLLNLANLSGQGGPGHTGGEIGPILNVPQTDEVLTAPAVWTNPADNSTWVFVANASGISGMQVTFTPSHTPTLTTRWSLTDSGTSPIIANNVLFFYSGTELRALNPLNGNLLWHHTGLSGVHWQSPIVANGVVYVPDNSGSLLAFSLNGKPPLTIRYYFPLIRRT